MDEVAPAARRNAPGLYTSRISFGLLILALISAVIAQLAFYRAWLMLESAPDQAIVRRNWALIGHAAAAVLALAAALSARRLPCQPARLPVRVAAALLLLCLALGAWLRWHRLADLPPAPWIDEALNGIAALEIAAEGKPRVYLEDRSAGIAAGFVNLTALFMALAQPSDYVWAVRSMSSLLGMTGLLGLALLAWRLLGPRCALVAVLFLAVSQQHVNYSRWGCMPVVSSAVEAWLLLAVAVGLSADGWRRWAAWSAAGILFGAGYYTYMSFRLVGTGLLLFGLALGLRHFRLVAARRGAIALAVALAALTLLPMIAYMWRSPGRYADRARQTLVWYDHDGSIRDDWGGHLARSVSRSLLSFHYVGDDNPRHNLPRRPHLPFAVAILAPLGLVWCAAHCRRPAYLLVLVWFVLGLLPGALTHEAPHASRLLDALFPVALLLGVAVDALWSAARAVGGRAVAWPVAALFALVALWTARDEYRAYFVLRMQDQRYYQAYLPHEAAPGRLIMAASPELTIYLDPKSMHSPSARLIAWDAFHDPARDLRELRLLHNLPPRETADRPALYILSPPYEPLLPALEALYPRARQRPVINPFGGRDAVTVEVADDDLNSAGAAVAAGTFAWPCGLLGRFYRDNDGRGEPFHQAVAPYLFCDYPINAEPLGDFGFAEWTGHILLPVSGEYYFRLNPDSTTLAIGDRQLLEHQGEACFGGNNGGHATFDAGVYPVRITYQRHPKVPYFLWFFWRLPDGPEGWVPASVLFPPGAPLPDTGRAL